MGQDLSKKYFHTPSLPKSPVQVGYTNVAEVNRLLNDSFILKHNFQLVESNTIIILTSIAMMITLSSIFLYLKYRMNFRYQN